MPASRFVLLAAHLLLAPVLAQTPTLVADLNKQPPADQAMEPSELVRVGGGVVFFAGFTHELGRELYRTSGGKPTLVADIVPGSYSSNPTHLTLAGNKLAFVVNRHEIWFSDGTKAGTQRVRGAGAFGTWPIHLTATGNRLFFLQGPARGPAELWTSDGTTGGTKRLTGKMAEQRAMQSVGSTLYFSGSSAAGLELWKSDGTVTGTTMVKDILPGSGSSRPRYFGTFGNKLVFSATGPTSTAHWISDGTAAGTKLLVDTNGTANGTGYSNRVTVGNRHYFGAIGTSGGGLWATGGTPSTTKQVVSLPLVPSNLTVHNSKVFFVIGNTLWRTDGTASGTKTIYTGNGRSLTILGSTGLHLYLYSTIRYSHGIVYLPFATSGASTGATSLGTLAVNPYGSFASPIVGTGMFVGRSGTSGGFELVSSKGTAATTKVTYDYRSPPRFTVSSHAGPRTDYGPFVAGVWENGVFLSDGTAKNTRLAGSRGSLALQATLDGIPFVANTKTLDRIDPATGKSTTIFTGRVTACFRLGSVLYFIANDTTSQSSVWRTDGTAAGTSLVKKMGPLSYASPKHVTYRGAIYAVVQHVFGSRLWRIDGTTAGTFEVKLSSTPYHSIQGVATLGNKLILPSSTGLLSSDGTALGTQKIGTAGWGGQPVALGGALYFLGSAAPQFGLWRTDGTAIGTVLIRKVGIGVGRDLVLHRGEMFFYANDFTTGGELWKSNGTQSGTKLIKDIYPGTRGVSLTLSGHAISAGRYVYFVGNDPKTGHELWRTDGTSAGTQLVHDLNTGPADAFPSYFQLHKGELWFVADNGIIGREPWRVDVGAVAHRVGFGCAAQGLPPQLAATAPRLGSTLTLDVTGIASGARAAVLAFGVGVTRNTYVGSGCLLHVDFALPIILQYLRPNNGAARLSLSVPNVASLHGALVPTQVAAGPTTNAPLGIDLSHGLFLAFRR